ncbi:MAG: bifunctional DNA primase/polymerase [Polyangiaceae bacterium]
MSALLRAALDYAALGWPVFPLAPKSKKPPASSDGFKSATTDEAQIRAWWTAEPQANIGAACGSFVVLDVDVKPSKGKRGDVELVEIVRERGPIGWTRQALTPSRGTHFFFAVPDGVRILRTIGRFAPAIDVLGFGGYVVLPPSRIDDGGDYPGDYVWCDDGAPLAEPSAWVLERMVRLSAPEQPTGAQFVGSWAGDYEKRAERAINYVAKMPIAVSGAGGHDALWRVALVVVRGFDLPIPAAREILRDYSARCDPPWSDREIDHKLAQAQRARDPRFHAGYLLQAGR